MINGFKDIIRIPITFSATESKKRLKTMKNEDNGGKEYDRLK